MKAVIERELKLANLQNIEVTVTKIIQLYETKNSRHAVMIVGLSGSGKSVTWKMLRNTLSTLRKENKGAQYQSVKVGGRGGTTPTDKTCRVSNNGFPLNYRTIPSTRRRSPWGSFMGSLT